MQLIAYALSRPQEPRLLAMRKYSKAGSAVDSVGIWRGSLHKNQIARDAIKIVCLIPIMRSA